MKKSIFILFLLFAGFFNLANAQVNVSGIINDYAKVTSIDFPSCQICDTSIACMNEIQVQNSSPFSVGDKVLIIQMKGAEIDETNTLSGGQITAINEAGNYEFFNVKKVTGNAIYPQRQLTRLYDPGGMVQLVKVPNFTGDLAVNGSLTSAPWNPALGTGGVLALFVEGTITLNAGMTVKGQGYVGETVTINGNPDNCSLNPNTQMNKPAASTDVSPKGNGIVVNNPSVNGGRAPRANGGGGGVSGDSGGGGGSNYGAGGNGGDRWCNQTLRAGGIGVFALLPFLSLNKVFLGGAGGSIALAVNDVVGNLNIDISGGDGQSLGTPVLHGPGGGGGALLHTLPVFPPNINVDVGGGRAGTHGGVNQNNTNNGTPGEDGGVVFVENVIREFNKGVVDVQNPVCDACNGVLNIKEFSATSSLTYSIDGGQSFTGSSLFVNLCKDTFEIQVVDEDGCVFDTVIANNIDTN